MDSLVTRARQRLLRMHFESGVGHIGGNLSALDGMLVLFHRVMRPDDVFVLAKGHAAGALYVTLWTASKLSDEDLKTFHADGTRLAGHPVPGWSADIPFATGSLGHGLPDAVGMALGYKLQGKPGRVFCMTSDGEWQEGSNWEALIFGLHNQLSNLTIIVDENRLQGFGSTRDVASMDPLEPKMSGFGADTTIVDGHDWSAIEQALGQSASKPRVVLLQTVKGKGVSFMENRMEWHYLPLTRDQFETAMEEISCEKTLR